MARAMCCDRCGEFFKFDDEKMYDRKYRLLDRSIKGHAMVKGDWAGFVDICDKCYEKLEQFMDNKDFLCPDEYLEHGDGTVVYPNGKVEKVIKED